MKKIVSILLAAVLVLTLFAGCGSNSGAGVSAAPTPAPSETPAGTPAEASGTKEATTLKVGANITPHAEILAVAKGILAKQNINLEVVEFTDYVLPNTAVNDGELDANYFQHQPYLDQFNQEHGTDLVSVASIHYEPFGIYTGKTASVEELRDGAVIAVPNDSTNEARALLLLEAQGLIKLKEGAGLKATALDIAENPKNLAIKELEAAQLTISLQDVDLAVINGNYAIQAGLNANADALATEDKDSEAAQTYANVIAVKKGNENNPAVRALIEALKSDKVKKYIEDTYKGAVVPIF